MKDSTVPVGMIIALVLARFGGGGGSGGWALRRVVWRSPRRVESLRVVGKCARTHRLGGLLRGARVLVLGRRPVPGGCENRVVAREK